jgi:hypothetical protein
MMSAHNTDTVKVTGVRRGEQDQAEHVSADVRQLATKYQDPLERQNVAQKPIPSSVKNSTKLIKVST